MPAKSQNTQNTFQDLITKDTKQEGLNLNLRPDIQGLVVDGEDAEEDVFEGPFGTVVAQDVLVVSEVSRQSVVLHELVLDFLP